MSRQPWVTILIPLGTAVLSWGRVTLATNHLQQPVQPLTGAPLIRSIDLVPVDLAVNKGARDAQGNPVVQFACYVKNTGTAPAGPFVVTGYIDAATPLRYVGPNPMPVLSLAAGAQVAHKFQVAAKEFTAPGGQYTGHPNPHSYTCYADRPNRVAESNETNNKRAQAFTVP